MNIFNNFNFARTALAVPLTIVMLITSACWPREKNQLLIVIIDLTGSVPPDAQADAFRTIQAGFKQLKRGDQLVIIPVIGDTAADLPGRVLRFELSRKRTAYDEDLKQLARQVQAKLEELQSRAVQHPAKMTDLFGALGLAAEDARQQQAAAKAANRDLAVRVAVLSDFVQDDGQAHFKRDPRLANEPSAQAYAVEMGAQKPIGWSGVRLYLGLVRSDDVRVMPQERRDAIKNFWVTYCTSGRPQSLQYATDGPGQAEEFFKA